MEFGLKGIKLGIYTHSFVERSHVWIRPDDRSCKTALLPESTCWRSHLTNHLPVNEEFNTTRCPFEAVNMKTGSIVVLVINSASIIIRLLLRQYTFKCSFFYLLLPVSGTPAVLTCVRTPVEGRLSHLPTNGPTTAREICIASALQNINFAWTRPGTVGTVRWQHPNS